MKAYLNAQVDKNRYSKKTSIGGSRHGAGRFSDRHREENAASLTWDVRILVVWLAREADAHVRDGGDVDVGTAAVARLLEGRGLVVLVDGNVKVVRIAVLDPLEVCLVDVDVLGRGVE